MDLLEQKCHQVIMSCQTEAHFKSAQKYISNYLKLIGNDLEYLDMVKLLNTRYRFMFNPGSSGNF